MAASPQGCATVSPSHNSFPRHRLKRPRCASARTRIYSSVLQWLGVAAGVYAKGSPSVRGTLDEEPQDSMLRYKESPYRRKAIDSDKTLAIGRSLVHKAVYTAYCLATSMYPSCAASGRLALMYCAQCTVPYFLIRENHFRWGHAILLARWASPDM